MPLPALTIAAVIFSVVLSIAFAFGIVTITLKLEQWIPDAPDVGSIIGTVALVGIGGFLVYMIFRR